MRHHNLTKHAWIAAVFVMAAAVLIGVGTLAGSAASQYIVSQKGREFQPGRSDHQTRRGDDDRQR